MMADIPNTINDFPPEYYIPGIDLLKSIPREELYAPAVCPLPVISRDEWGAQPPKNPEPMTTPLTHVRFTDTSTRQCTSKEDCIELLREMQKRDVDKEGLQDIKYSFMISSDGTIFEGRGWHTEPDRPDHRYGENLKCLKGKSLDIGFIGTFDESMTEEVPFRMCSAAFHFTAWAGRHDLLADYFSITQLREPDFDHPLNVAPPYRDTGF